MGAVYRAVHPDIGRTVAIKILKPELAASEEAIARFFDEARAVNAIRHEGIVDIFDLGRREDGSTYYVMEHLIGEDLSRLIKREQSLPANEAVPLVLQVASALSAAHRRGIVHRDLKPQNLFVVPRGGERRMKLLDFGIAKLVSELSDRPTTSTGVVLGTIPYMAPEQARGEHVDARADVYSLGCILFELLTGQVPFAARNAIAVLARLATEEPAAPSARAFRFGVPPELDAIVLRMLAKNRERRYSDLEEVVADLRALDLSNLPPPSPTIEQRPVEDATAPTMSEANLPTIPHHKLDLPTPPPSTPAPTLGARSPDPIDALAAHPIGDSTRRLREVAPALIDPSTERRIIKVVIPILATLVLLGVGLYYMPGAISVDRRALGHWLPVFVGAAISLAGLLVLVGRTQQSSRGRVAVNRAVTLLSVALITTSVYLKGAVTSYDILYYPALTILDRLRADRSLGRFTLVTSIIGFASAVALCYFGVLPYAPLYPGRISPELVHDPGLAIIVLLVMSGLSTLSLLLVDQLARRVQRREAELRELGLSLAGRIEEQVELLRRSSDLRHYLPPALADAILRGDAASQAHARRRVTIVRVDCPAIAGAVDDADPEEFAHLLNALYARLADRASEHGGVVDRFGDAGAQVLFGSTATAEPLGEGVSALAAVAFARAALAAIESLASECQAAGVSDMPAGRAAIHQGFATLGSFGSPSRREFTAVGPSLVAARQVHERTEIGRVLLTQPVEASLRGAERLEPDADAVFLAGTRHPVRLFRLI